MLECDDILREGYFEPELRRGLISHQRPKMMVSMKQTKQFRWLCPMRPFLPYLLYGRWQIVRRRAFQKALYIIDLSILCISQSDSRHLHWIPHKLSDSQQSAVSSQQSAVSSQQSAVSSQKASRVELLIRLPDVLLSIRHQGLMGTYIHF
jgi:hypothetical protein